VLLPSLAAAGDSEPRIAKDAVYFVARQDLIRQGFDPVPILDGREEYVCRHHPRLCRIYPEVKSCTQAGRALCSYLFRRRSDGQLWMVGTEGEENHSPYLNALRVHGAWRADESDVRGLVTANAARIPSLASAADTLPRFRRDTPYLQVRAQMIKLGFEPARILKRSGNSPMGCGQSEPDMCKRWPEILHCSEGISRCDFLFFRRSDGARILVVTEGDNDIYNCYCFVEVRWPDDRDSWKLDEAVIARPASAGRGQHADR